MRIGEKELRRRSRAPSLHTPIFRANSSIASRTGTVRARRPTRINRSLRAQVGVIQIVSVAILHAFTVRDSAKLTMNSVKEHL